MTDCEIEIRSLDAGDVEAFLALKRIGLASDPGSFVGSLDDDGPEYPDAVARRLASCGIRAGDIVLGAFAPDLVGIIAITRGHHAKRAHKADLHGMYVRAEFRGRGLGRRLLDRALADARLMAGLEEVQLIVATHNEAAARLYQRYGFHIDWTERHALRLADRSVDAHHMTLNMRGTAAGSP
jgi:ribosomal protein S18 acetylase RimI-like enzyme